MDSNLTGKFVFLRRPRTSTWMEFLCIEDNQTHLYLLPAEGKPSTDEFKQVPVRSGKGAWQMKETDGLIDLERLVEFQKKLEDFTRHCYMDEFCLPSRAALAQRQLEWVSEIIEAFEQNAEKLKQELFRDSEGPQPPTKPQPTLTGYFALVDSPPGVNGEFGEYFIVFDNGSDRLYAIHTGQWSRMQIVTLLRHNYPQIGVNIHKCHVDDSRALRCAMKLPAIADLIAEDAKEQMFFREQAAYVLNLVIKAVEDRRGMEPEIDRTYSVRVG